MIRSLWLSLPLAICAACADTPLMPRSNGAAADAEPARLVVYWPADSFIARNAEKPEVALNNRRIGSFSAGGEVARGGLTPGIYRLAIRRPATNAPSKEIGTFDLPFEPGKTVYVRYTDESFGSLPTTVESISARVRMVIVDDETGAARR